ncbi:GNAT family acetyltransferase [Actinomyces mediterranea]|uniref:GNAT family acetyltransferase n=1 Tax=Actinomyces mediterranea TaxID=1871028 RepID=UPI0009708B33|nr:GNAT family acetyltransferase [Actinomyces mediterranea]
MTTTVISELNEADAPAAAHLWAECGLTVPYNDPETDYLRALHSPSSTVLGIRATVAPDAESSGLIGTVMVGHEGHRGWMYYVAVHPDHRGRGLGAALVRAAEEWLDERGAPKAMLMVRATNERAQGFYRALGYETSTVTVMQKWLCLPRSRG